MSQISARMYIKVKDVKDWDKLYNIDVEGSFAISAKDLFSNNDSDEFLIDGEWSPYLSEFRSLIANIQRALGNDGFVIADLTDMDVDPFDIVITSLLDSYGTCTEHEINDTEMHYDVEIDDVETMFKKARIRVTKVENLQYLAQFAGSNFDFARKKLEAMNNK